MSVHTHVSWGTPGVVLVLVLEGGPLATVAPGGFEGETRMEGEAGMERKARMEGEVVAWQTAVGQGG